MASSRPHSRRFAPAVDMLTFKQFAVEWGRALRAAPQLFRRMAFRPRTIEEELIEANLKGTLRKALRGYNILSLGCGQVIGSGVFILTGQAALMTGPAVIVSYLLSGVAATLAAACYAEFAMEYPVAGAGFTYIMLTFGELPAWITVTNLMLEYVLGMAAIARGFSQYIARIFLPGDPRVDEHFITDNNMDWLAFGIVLLLSVVAASGVRESAFAITVITVVHLCLLLAIIVAQYIHASPANLSPFLYGGADNMFAAGAVLFFAFAGYDVLATTSEEARKPEHIPRAIVATPVVATCIYVAMTLGLVMFVNLLDMGANHTFEFGRAAFSTAFDEKGMMGMYYVSCAAALTGIFASLMVGLYGTSRIVMGVARDWLLPPFLATISPRTQTPIFAHLVSGIVVAILALLVRFSTLSDLVSLGAVLVMWLVANALLFRRYYPGVPRLRYSRWGTVESAEGGRRFSAPGTRLQLSLRARQWLVIGHLVMLNLFCLGLTIFYQIHTQYLKNRYGTQGMREMPTDTEPQGGVMKRWEGELVLGTLWLLTTLSMQLFCPLEYEPPKWKIQWWMLPWLPSLAILLMTFIIGSLQNRYNYAIFGYWLAGSLVFYLLFSMPMSYIKHTKLDFDNTEQMNVVELTFKDGRWQEPRSSFRGLHLAASASGLPSLAPSQLTSARESLQQYASRLSSIPSSQQRLSGIPSHLALQLHQMRASTDSESGGKRGKSEGSEVSSSRLTSELAERLGSGSRLTSSLPSLTSTVGRPATPPRHPSPTRPAAGSGNGARPSTELEVVGSCETRGYSSGSLPSTGGEGSPQAGAGRPPRCPSPSPPRSRLRSSSSQDEGEGGPPPEPPPPPAEPPQE